MLATPVRLEDAVLVGAGAVGNGFLRAARHLDIGGTLTVVDPKVVGSGNSNRCLYFTDADVGKPKAERLCANAQGDFPHLKPAPVIGTFADLVKSRGRMRRAIITADSRRARRSIQKDLPLEVLDASTTGVSEVIVHSHRQPNPGACHRSRSDRSDIVAAVRIARDSSPSNIGDPPSNQATTLESQVIHRIQYLSGRTLSDRNELSA